MCLAVPGKIIERYEEHGLATGKVDFSGTVVPICLAYVPEAKVGEYVIVHAGFALSVIDEEEAQKTFALFDEIERADSDSRQDQAK